AEQTVIVPARTQIAAAGAVGDEPIIFETDQALIALAAQLQRLLVLEDGLFADVTQQNADAAEPFQPFAAQAHPGSAFVLGFGYHSKFAGRKDNFPKTQLNLTFYVHTEGVRPATAVCGLPESQVFPSAELKWEYWGRSGWLPLTLDKDTTRSLMRSGHV